MALSEEIIETLNSLGTMQLSTMHKAFQDDADAHLMYNRYCNEYNYNNIDFYIHLCDIDTWRFNRFLGID